MLRFFSRFQADFQLKSGWIEPLLVGGYAPFSPYGVGVAIDAATSAAFAWAIGATAKEYFQREYLGKSKLSKDELGKIFREAFKEQKNK